jgi:hypothetical protein
MYQERTAMSPLFYIAAVLSLSAIAVTVYAYLTAEEGLEDEEGFHAVKPHVPSSTVPSSTRQSDPKIEAFLSAHR